MGISTVMATKEVDVSALQALTSDEFERSSLVGNSALEALITEYFGGSDDDTDMESVWSDDEEIHMFINNNYCAFCRPSTNGRAKCAKI